jgi:hypothetical protein
MEGCQIHGLEGSQNPGGGGGSHMRGAPAMGDPLVHCSPGA